MQQAQEAWDHLHIRRRQGERLNISGAQFTGPEERGWNPNLATAIAPATAGGALGCRPARLDGFLSDCATLEDVARG